MKKRFSEEQIIGFLREAEAGVAVKDLCRRHGFSEASYYLWRSKFGGMSVSDAKRLKELEAENTRLKKLLAEQMFENDVIKDVPGVTVEKDGPERPTYYARGFQVDNIMYDGLPSSYSPFSMAVQPNPFSDGETIVVPRTSVGLEIEGGNGLAEITGGTGHDMAGMDHGAPASAGDMGGMAGMDHGSMGGMAITMDLRLDYSSGALPNIPILMLLDREADVHMARRSGANGWMGWKRIRILFAFATSD